MWKLYGRKQNNILLHVVDIGSRKIKVPVAQLGKGEGKTVLITAGLDGDEYAGIEAAYALIEYYFKAKFIGKLIIIPIVNIPGFEEAMSWNPIDHKYPKHIFPGKEKGTATERLMHWLSANFVKGSDLWIDLHSGASTEILAPYIEISDTSRKKPTVLLADCLRKLKAEIIILSQTKFGENIAKKDVAYIRLESGNLGQRNKKDIQQHIDWVKQILSSLVILEKSPPAGGRPIESNKKLITKIVYRIVDEFLAEKEGIWIPVFLKKTIKKNMLLGVIRSLDGKILQKITAKESGVFLWRREAMSCQKGDSLFAYAYNKKKIIL